MFTTKDKYEAQTMKPYTIILHH